MEKEAAGTRGGYWLETQSAEYDLVKYHLHTAIEAVGIIDKLSVWKIINPELQYRFERRSSGMLRLQSWYNADLCVEQNSLENVCSGGFQIDKSQESGFYLPIGVIKTIGDLEEQRECCFLLLDVAVGRSYVYDGSLRSAPIPNGYDSLYIPDQPLDRNKDGKFSLQEYQTAAHFDFRASRYHHLHLYSFSSTRKSQAFNFGYSGYRHNYFIPDTSQLCPKYVVRFQLQKARLGRGAELELDDVEFVDPITLQPTNSNRSLSLSSSFEKRQVSVSVEAAFAQAVDDLAKMHADPTSLTKQQWVQKQLSIVEDKVRDINLNYAEVAESIEQAAAQAQKRLQDLVRQKLELCLSLEIELRRQTEQVDWLDGVLSNELQKVQSAMVASSNLSTKRKLMLRFLKLWKQHSLHRNTLSRAKPFELQAISSLHPDLRVQTDIKIFVDPFYASSSVSSAKNPEATAEPAMEEHEAAVRNFNLRASEHNYFNTPVQSAHPFLAPAVRALIDQEMSNVQKLLSSASKQGSSLLLPPSVTGTTIGGAGAVNQALLGMHAMLDMVKSLPSPSSQHHETLTLDTVEQVRQAFSSSIAIAHPEPYGDFPTSH
jgi:hypothetical protein